MNATFSVVADPARDLIRITLAGMFDDRSIAEFLAARRAAHAQLRCGPGQQVTLVDARAYAIQTQDTVTRWGAVLADPVHQSRRLAFVAESPLVRMQVQRASGSRADRARVFAEPIEAEAWLLAPDPASEQVA